jgi:hypothetical protein
VIIHRETLLSSDINKLGSFIERLINQYDEFNEIVIMTSAAQQQMAKANRMTSLISYCQGEGVQVNFIGQYELFKLLNNNKDIADKYFTAVLRKVKTRTLAKYLSVLAAISSILGLLFGLYFQNKQVSDSPLKQQIESVEETLNGVKNLEINLRRLKNDLENTAKESEKIKIEYEKALKLRQITSEQLTQIKKAISSQSKSEVIFNYSLGFLFGVASSILGAIIVDRIKRRRALQKENV